MGIAAFFPSWAALLLLLAASPACVVSLRNAALSSFSSYAVHKHISSPSHASSTRHITCGYGNHGYAASSRGSATYNRNFVTQRAATSSSSINGAVNNSNSFENNKDIKVLLTNKVSVGATLYLLYILTSTALRNKEMVLKALDLRYFFVGCLCSAYSHGITCPIDVIKTMIQTYPEKYSKSSSIVAARAIIRDHGALFLMQGLWPTIIGYGFEGGVKFGAYEFLKAILSNFSSYKMLNYTIASVIAGILASLVLCPMEEVRIKMVGDESWEKEGFVSGCSRLLKEHGIFGTFSGMRAMLSKQVPYTVMKQAAFDIIAGALYSTASLCGLRALDIKWIISIAAAFLTSIVSCIASMPGDVILTQTYASYNYQCAVDGDMGCSYTNDFDAIVRKIYRERGLMGFFVGFQTRLFHVVSVVTSQLVFYDAIKIAVGLKSTGSH